MCSNHANLIKDRSGASVIEATIIIPLFVFIISGILYLTLFLYNRCSLERACDMAALRGSQAVWSSADEQYKRAENGIEEILRYNLLGDCKVMSEIRIQEKKVRVTLQGEFLWWNYETEESKRVINPVQFVRTCTKINTLVNKLEE